MTNTVLCGSVSYKHTVKENEDNTELEISTAIHSDMNGTEKNFNFPMKEFVLNSAEVTIEENIGEVLEKFLRLSPENKKEIRELAEKAFDNSKYKNVYKNLPNIENSEQARKLGIDAIYDEVIKELANRRFEKIIKNSPDCIDDIQKLLNSDNPADKTANCIIKIKHLGNKEFIINPIDAPREFLLKVIEIICGGGIYHEEEFIADHDF